MRRRVSLERRKGKIEENNKIDLIFVDGLTNLPNFKPEISCYKQSLRSLTL